MSLFLALTQQMHKMAPVLLGNNTAGKTATIVENATVNGLTLENFAGASKANANANANIGTVSVGSQGKERQIVHVGAGQISATSTDAINGSQLHAFSQSCCYKQI